MTNRLSLCRWCLGLIFACLVPVFRTDAGEAIVYSHFANAGPLNPHLYSPNQMYAQELVYEPLVRTGDAGDIEPALAERWSVSADGLVYTFHLRDGVVFTDGRAFDADAVVRNFDAILANRARHAWLELANKIASYRAVDDLTFELTLTAPYYPTLNDLALPRPFRFISPEAIPANGTSARGIDAPVGTGRYILAESRLGIHDRFTPNPNHWSGAPAGNDIVVKIIPDPMSRAMALETGEIDLVFGHGQISYDVFAALRRNPNFETAVSDPMGTVALAIHTGKSPTDDRRVRQALQHMVDKDAIVRGILLDSQPRADFLFAPDVPYADVGLVPYAYDPDAAGRLLDEAGWHRRGNGGFRERDGVRLAIDLVYIGNDAAHKALAETIQGQAARAGVFINLQGVEEDLFLRRQRDGDFGMIMSPTWGPPFEPHTVLGSMRLPAHADFQAQSGLPDKAGIDRDITGALESTDETDRAAAIDRVLTILHEEAVYLPIHYTCLFYAHRTSVLAGVHFAPGRTLIPFEDFRKPGSRP
ncbi:MAG: nickel ABC transporter substrate-binding protein [Planctomycetaceae bacterium]|nr:nickel ABC transporter substrate-binding protein [Planctomycetaceae bacterium]